MSSIIKGPTGCTGSTEYITYIKQQYERDKSQQYERDKIKKKLSML